jgi:protein TonB
MIEVGPLSVSEMYIVAPPTENTGPAETESEIFSVVEEMPEPPGGIASFLKYLGSTVRYPEMAKEAGIQGKVFLKFVVEKDGSLTDVQVLKGVPGCGDCDREAVKAVKAYPNKWKAGRQNGRELRVAYTVPFSFRLQ